MWQCDWDKQVSQNVEIKNFVEQFHIPDRLNIRDSFFGGRTNGIKLFHEVEQESSERIYYYDFTRCVTHLLILYSYPIFYNYLIYFMGFAVNYIFIYLFSLYPFVCKYGRFPTCHPTIITSNFDWTLKSYFGVVKCKILPPQGKFISLSFIIDLLQYVTIFLFKQCI